MTTLQFDEVTKIFPGPTMAVEALDLTLDDGELLILLGPSGCGKSTALRMVAGLESVTSGSITLDGERINDQAPQHRDVAMVFQSYALYPHLTVRENMGLNLRTAKVSKADTKHRVEQAARMLDIEQLLDATPATLSGGQSQRVAIGRAIVREPRLFLMDEPLSALDAKLRTHTRAELAQLLATLGATALYVTHDQVEAMSIADRIAVMNHGQLQQVGPPAHLYDEPANLFVAGFVGSPPMNLLPAVIRLHEGDLTAWVGDQPLPVTPRACRQHAALRQRDGAHVVLGVRPEHIKRVSASSTGTRIGGRLRIGEALGPEVMTHIEVATPASEIAADALDDVAAARDDLTQTNNDTTVMIARLSPGDLPAPGARLEVLVPEHAPLWFFDPTTGRALPRD